jgi:hypothetical protein
MSGVRIGSWSICSFIYKRVKADCNYDSTQVPYSPSVECDDYRHKTVYRLAWSNHLSRRAISFMCIMQTWGPSISSWRQGKGWTLSWSVPSHPPIWNLSEVRIFGWPSVMKVASEALFVSNASKKFPMEQALYIETWKLAFVSVCQRNHRLEEANYRTLCVVYSIRYSDSDWLPSILFRCILVHMKQPPNLTIWHADFSLKEDRLYCYEQSWTNNICKLTNNYHHMDNGIKPWI